MLLQNYNTMVSYTYRYSIFFISSYYAVSVVADSISSLQQPRTLCYEHEKLALLGFRESFLTDCGQAYDTTSSYPKVKSWKAGDGDGGGDCCTWDGVQCDESTGHVTGLDLSGSCLYGTFPSNSTLFGLDHLLELNLANNNFNFSEIPLALGHLQKLTSLNLSKSFFSGQIPWDISKLSRLSLLDLSYNGDPLGRIQFNLKLHDPGLEKLVRKLTHLSNLYLAYVDISSSVPAILRNLTSLKVLILHGCNLYGVFPRSILQLQNLEEVDLSYNRDLRGYLPEFQSNCPLRRLDLSSTAFSGELPPSIGNLGNLNELILWNCHFFGSIPSSLGNLTKLTSLALGDNNFGGHLPSSVTNLTELSSLCLSNLNVSLARLSSWVLSLEKVTVLAFTHMNLSGELPYFLANLTRLTYLDLSSNNLNGPLPYWLSNLTHLTDLNLDYNQLQGPVPQWLSQLTNLQIVQLSYNNSAGEFDTFLKLQNLHFLSLSGVSLTFPLNTSTNSSLRKFDFVVLDNCKLSEFPHFLRSQDELQFLSLKGNNIMGSIPQWFVNITRESLLSLDLSENFLTGFDIPPVSLPWSNLLVLDLSGNELQGLLPAPVNSMQIYRVSDNQFSGAIPKQICRASSLIYLDLSNNSMSGRIPDCIGHKLAGSLVVLNLQRNSFCGTIPQRILRSCRLKMINLSQNQLEGKLPKSLGNCAMLEILDIGKNRFSDTFPSWLGSLPKLQVLVLRHNHFYGRIIAPPESGHPFRCLRILDLSHNFHTGDLPSRYLQHWHAMEASNSKEDQSNPSNSAIDLYFMIAGYYYIKIERYNYTITITNKGTETFYSRILTVFRVIDFSSNSFTGVIPEFIGDLRGLQALNFSNNNIAGKIPSSLSKIRDLESLDLSQNMLSGKVPQELTKLTSLEVFNVSHNHLVGPIPQGNQFNTFDNNSFYGNLALCGNPLSNMCGNTNSPPPSPPLLMTNSETEEDSKLIDWVVRLSGCVGGFIIGFVIGKIYVTDRHHHWFMETFGRKRRFKTRARREPR